MERTSPAHGASFFFLRPPTLELSVAFSSQRRSRARAARALAAGTSSRRWRRGHGEEATSLSAAGAALGTASLRSSKSCGLSVRGNTECFTTFGDRLATSLRGSVRPRPEIWSQRPKIDEFALGVSGKVK